MRQTPQQIPHFIDELDLNKAAFFELCGLQSDIVIDGPGRVTFSFPANNQYFELTARWNNNEPAPCLSYANEIRKLRARMLAAKTENGQGERFGSFRR